MQRRQPTSTRRNGSFPFAGALNAKSKSSPLLSICLVLVGAVLLLVYAFSGPGLFGGTKIVSKIEGDFSCTLELQRAVTILKKAFGNSMRKVLHVGPDTCSVVSKLLKEGETEAWGIEPYDIEDADGNCKSLVNKGIVRVADIKFPLPYRAKSFSHVIVSDALDYLSPKYLNKTLPEFARVSSDGLVIFTVYLLSLWKLHNHVVNVLIEFLDAVLLLTVQVGYRGFESRMENSRQLEFSS
ncbi:hypothetical protein E5676_scaffold255G003760 [Cucumis melo var. makuwa]|uniref:Uncharacterized protein n=1 Tax=Cucumis melo var. makuwa TaxID=1194695 RepID=A0A5A7T4B0_CUCMM|nr:hypothetical protein E6C27_scaffold18G001920 [Cucumis melo var. makuwa]TYK12787.1 hypothetical protein E5676_scaffold255G003760 [Cucumis melo var. makuwa]